MPISNIIVDTLVAQGEGVDQSTAVKLAVVSDLLIPASPFSAIVAKVLAQREVPAASETVAPQMVDLPGFIDDPVDQAEKQLKALGFVVGPPATALSQRQPGIVISQDPKPGLAPKGSTVTLTISSKVGETTNGLANPTQVPALITSAVGAAEQRLKERNLGVVKIETDSESDRPGSVIAQKPPENAIVEKGTTVHLFVSKPPPKKSEDAKPQVAKGSKAAG